MRTHSHALLLGIVALLAVGCAGRTVLRAYVPVPPQLAVRVFPEVVVVSGRTPDEIGLADAIAIHLARSGRGRIERVRSHEIELRRASGGFGPATAVLAIETHVQERAPRESSRYGASCWTEQCLADQRPSVEATLRLRVSEARSARVLQEVELRERDDSSDPDRRHALALARLRARAIAALEPTQVAVMLPLQDVDDPQVRSAIGWLRDGQARRARRALDRVARHASFSERSPAEQARILFDLGQALRLEARGHERIAPPELDAAERAIRRAVMLDPCSTYLEAMTQVASEREAEQRMRDIDAATHANFALAMPSDVPAPPPGYGYAMAP